MPSVIDLYERLATATDDKARARIIAEAFEALEERYPRLSDTATRADLRETELRLLKEIEQVRADLKTEIEQMRGDVRVEIERVRADLRGEMVRGHESWLKWSFLFWVTQFGAIVLLLWRLWPET